MSHPWRPSLTVMGVWCLLLAVSFPAVADLTWGPVWITSGLFAVAGATNLALLVFRQGRNLRLLTVGVTVGAFAWRAMCAAITWHRGGITKPFSVLLYIGFAVLVMLRWPAVLPSAMPTEGQRRVE